LLRATPPGANQKRIFMPLGTSHETGQTLRDEAWVTVYGLDDEVDARDQAVHQGCSHIYEDGKAVPLNPAS